MSHDSRHTALDDDEEDDFQKFKRQSVIAKNKIGVGKYSSSIEWQLLHSSFPLTFPTTTRQKLTMHWDDAVSTDTPFSFPPATSIPFLYRKESSEEPFFHYAVVHHRASCTPPHTFPPRKSLQPFESISLESGFVGHLAWHLCLPSFSPSTLLRHRPLHLYLVYGRTCSKVTLPFGVIGALINTDVLR